VGQITGRKEVEMKGYAWYNISADGGETWTTQYLTTDEAENERKAGYIVEPERKTP